VSPLNSRTAAKFQRQKVNSDTIILGLNEEVKKQGNSLQLEEMKVNFFFRGNCYHIKTRVTSVGVTPA